MKISKRKERQIENRIFNAQSRLFAGELPDRVFKNGEELDFRTVKSNDLPRIERLQEGYLYEGLEGYIWKVTKLKSDQVRLYPTYRFKKEGKYKINIRYRRGNFVELHFNSEMKRNLYFDELINGRKIREVHRNRKNQHIKGRE